MKTIVPEIVWIGLVQYEHGHRRGVELITSLARAACSVRSEEGGQIFAAASSYSVLSADEWAQLRESMVADGNLAPIQESLRPLVALYPECPLASVFPSPPEGSGESELLELRDLVASLFNRTDRDPMMVQATAIWLAFDAGVLKVREGLALSQFPEIERYPETELSRKVGGAIRAALNMFFGEGALARTSSSWPQYFWNRGLVLSDCEVSDE